MFIDGIRYATRINLFVSIFISNYDILVKRYHRERGVMYNLSKLILNEAKINKHFTQVSN